MPPYEHDPYRPELHDSNSNPPSENSDFTVNTGGVELSDPQIQVQSLNLA